ncbi:MAG: hypothetical protein LBJ00_09845 [Planctomycetaceae bacterium]|nr:hypothetical protein [Planctomycetaceae bacterium]
MVPTISPSSILKPVWAAGFAPEQPPRDATLPCPASGISKQLEHNQSPFYQKNKRDGRGNCGSFVCENFSKGNFLIISNSVDFQPTEIDRI